VAAAFECYTAQSKADHGKTSKHNRKVRRWTRFASIITLLYFLATVAIFIASIRSIQEAGRATHYASKAAIAATDQATTAADMERRQLRAYVGAADASISNARADVPKIHIFLKNFGSTPALEVHALTYQHIQNMEQIRSDDWIGIGPTPHDFGILDPNQPRDMVIPLGRINIPSIRKESAPTLHIKSCVTYQDVFGYSYTRLFTHYLNWQLIKNSGDWPLYPSPRGSRESQIGKDPEDPEDPECPRKDQR
jgi:hypothetical protein